MLKRKLILFSILVLSMVIIFSCQNQPIGLRPDSSQGQSPVTHQIVIPEGATVTSATLHIYVSQAYGHTIYVHRITAPWDEATVTWNSFAGAYASPAVTSFVTDQGNGWYEVELTDLVLDWINGVYNNYGILLDQTTVVTPATQYRSKEYGVNQPWMEVCYQENGGTECVQDIVLQDAFIRQLWPNSNYGLWDFLMTGWVTLTELEKQAMLQFEFEFTPPPDGCSRTIGYWKTHAGFGPQDDMVTPLLPIWLGTSGGAKSLEVTTAAMAVEILEMKTYGSNKNMITKLYAQLLGAKLNFASGASGMAVSDVVMAADMFLADHDWTDWDGLSEEDQEMVEDWQGALDDYNNGYIGPGHCEDADEDGTIMDR
jgi:hypothetical protein